MNGTKDYMLVKSDEAIHFFTLLMELITAIIMGIAVGGIGIMNVMLLVHGCAFLMGKSRQNAMARHVRLIHLGERFADCIDSSCKRMV